MPRRLPIHPMILLALFTCSLLACNKNDDVLAKVQGIHQALHEEHVPDRRVNRFDLEAYAAEGHKILFGETTLPAVKESFLAALREANIAYEDSIVVLPDARLGEANYALSRHSVANLRSKPGHSQELATQVLLGTPLRVLKQEDNWYFVQCPDGYLAWLNAGELTRMTATELNQWKQAERYVYTADYGHAYKSPMLGSKPMGDLVEGGILVKVGAEGSFSKMQYPDGRTAFVTTADLVPFATWANGQQLSIEQAERDARAQLGRPYLWGGTSPKGMDCSGFTKTVYWQQGLIIPRDASQQVKAGIPVIFDEELRGLEQGDFLFFGRYRDDGSEKITHVGIYLGAGAFIHSGADNGANRVENLLPNSPLYAVHRRESLLRARRLSVGSTGVQAVRQHEWY